MLSRLRSNNNLFGLPETPAAKEVGRPRKYGAQLGTASSLAAAYKEQAREYTVNLYGRKRTVLAGDRVFMVKNTQTPDPGSVGVSPDKMGGAVYHRSVVVSYRDDRKLWRQMENRGWFQRAEAGHRQERNPEQTSGGRKKSPGLLHDGHFAHLDLRLSIGKNSQSTTCG